MATRPSEYARRPSDDYSTPRHVTDSLIPFIPRTVRTVFEAAPGRGRMVRALEANGYKVTACPGDFFAHGAVLQDAIITNSPWGPAGRLAEQFITRALEEMAAGGVCFVAFLLRATFDSGHGPARLAAFDHKAFAFKVTLRRRIVWIRRAGSKAAPSEDHAWFCWSAKHAGPPAIFYSN
jgi:hypothetical protein